MSRSASRRRSTGLVVAVACWALLGLVACAAALGAPAGADLGTGVDAVRGELGDDAVATASPWPAVLALTVGVAVLVGAGLLAMGVRASRIALPVLGILAMLLVAGDRLAVAVVLVLFVAGTVATMSAGVHRHLTAI